MGRWSPLRPLPHAPPSRRSPVTGTARCPFPSVTRALIRALTRLVALCAAAAVAAMLAGCGAAPERAGGPTASSSTSTVTPSSPIPSHPSRGRPRPPPPRRRPPRRRPSRRRPPGPLDPGPPRPGPAPRPVGGPPRSRRPSHPRSHHPSRHPSPLPGRPRVVGWPARCLSLVNSERAKAGCGAVRGQLCAADRRAGAQCRHGGQGLLLAHQQGRSHLRRPDPGGGLLRRDDRREHRRRADHGVGRDEVLDG